MKAEIEDARFRLAALDASVGRIEDVIHQVNVRNLESRIVRRKISTGTHDTTWLLASLQYAFVWPQMYRIALRLNMSNGPQKLW